MCYDPLMSCLGAVLWSLLLSVRWSLFSVFISVSVLLSVVFSFLCLFFLCLSSHLSLLSYSSLPLSRCLFYGCPFIKVKVTLRLTVSQSVSLGIEPHLGPMTRYLFLSDSYVLVYVGRPLWREDGCVFCMCRWPLPEQYFSGPSPLGLATIYYCLRFETSLFVASYDSQVHGGGIRSRLHTG
jgi:hypothetical protein